MTKSLKNLIKDCKFDFVNEDITEKNFPKQNIRGKVELLHFDKEIESDEAIERMNKQGYEPANIYELLEYAKDGWNKEDAVVALGSVWRVFFGYRYVPCLWGGSGGRRLLLRWIGGAWDPRCRFAVVRKSDTNSLKSSEKTSDTLSLEVTVGNKTYAGELKLKT